MADTKITALQPPQPGYPIVPSTDVLPIVIIADPGMAASGSTRKATVNQLLGAGGTATLASATISGDLTVDTSTLKVDSANNRVGIVQAGPLYPLHLVGEFGLEEASAGNGSKLRIIGQSTKYNFRLGKQIAVDNAFEITPSTTVGGTTFSNPVYTVTYDGIHTFLDGAGGTRMTLNSTGLGVGASPLGTAAGRGNVTINGSTDAILALGNAGVLTGYVAQSTSGMDIVGVGATFVRIQTNGSARLLVDSAGNFIPTLQATAPTLGLNSQMVFNLTSNTNLRISVRGTDGTTRTADITLA